MIAFLIGIIAGITIAIVAGLVIVHWPEAPRTHEPVQWSAVGASRADQPSAGKSNAPDFFPRNLKESPARAEFFNGTPFRQAQ